jgi:hypothetical protein
VGLSLVQLRGLFVDIYSFIIKNAIDDLTSIHLDIFSITDHDGNANPAMVEESLRRVDALVEKLQFLLRDEE